MQLKKLEKITLQASLPERPTPLAIQSDGKEYAGFTLTQLDQLSDYAKQSKKNTDGLNLLAGAHNQTIEQYNLMVDIAKQQEARANENYARYVQEFDDHQNDKRWWSVEKIFWQAIAIIGLAL
jgi:hypothetical protein